MSESIYRYYERELLFIRQMAQEFARQYPAAAGRLLLEANRSVDPHVERLVEAFALLCGRVHHKLDDDFPELTEALLGVLYPHYLAPVPSVAVAQLVPDAGQAVLQKGFLVARHSRLRSQAVNDLPCRFRTAYPVTLWPLAVSAAAVQGPPFPAAVPPPPGAAALLRIDVECLGAAKLSGLALERLRFHLHGDGQLVAHLYELIFNHALQVVLLPGDGPPSDAAITLRPEQCLAPVGFEPDEGLLPYPRHALPGYRLLTEFFAFPGKFHFVDVAGLRPACQPAFGRKLQILVFLDHGLPRLEQGVDAGTFLLGCTPIVNLFEQTAEPIPLTQLRHEYPIVPDVAHPGGMEVYSVDAVTSVDPARGATTEYQPFYSFRHGGSPDQHRTFWYAARRPSPREGDHGTDVYLSLVDLGWQPTRPADDTLIVRTTCTNRDLPVHLQRAGERLALSLEGAAPLARIHPVRVPTSPLRPALRRGAQWRLISHLSLNHLSISDPVEGRAALQELLRLYDFAGPGSEEQRAAVTRQLIDGITAVGSRRVVGRTGGAASSGFCRGVEVTVEFDEEKYVGTGAFLFACVLERFLGLYVSINSFSQLVARTKQSEGVLRRWPPRTGYQQLL